MKRLALASLIVSIVTVEMIRGEQAPELQGRHLTFDEAIVLAGANRSRPPFGTSRSEIAALRRSALPSVRAEVTGNVSRTLENFTADPLDLRSTTSVLAFDYPLWDARLTRARVESAEAKLRRLSDTGRLDDGRFMQLVEDFGQLYLAQRQTELLRPLYERLWNESNRSAQLVSTGEITNLAAADWRETALAFGSQLLELEARRIDAAAKLQLLTGLEHEPIVTIDLGDTPTDATATAALRDDQMEASRAAVEDSGLTLRQVIASTRLQATLSGFVGLSAADAVFRDVNSHGAFGVYGLRVHLSYPLLGGTAAIQIAEARAALEQTLIWRDAALDAARTRVADYRLRAQIADRRIALYRQSIDAARDREESLQRLVRGGLRSPNELVRAEAERTRREAELLAAEIERWKASRLLARIVSPTEDNHR